MNPLIVLVLLFVLGNRNKGRPYIGQIPSIYFDTFRMELLLDRLRDITEALEKMNQMHHYVNGYHEPGDMASNLGTSLEIAKTFLANTKAERQLEQVMGMIEIMKEFDGI